MKCPPLDGSVSVLPGFTDFQAEHNPNQPCVIFPSRQSPREASAVTFLEFAHATHRMAHALRPGRSGSEGEVAAILVNCDTLLYVALVVGSVRAGLVPFPMSPRNSPEAIHDMLQKTGCHRIIMDSSLSGLISAVRACCSSSSYDLRVDHVPTLDSVFPQFGTECLSDLGTDVVPYPSDPRQRLQDDVVFYLHSSGSTGFPKPIPQTENRILQRIQLPLMEETSKHQVRWATMTLLTFHTIGFFLQVYVPMTTGLPVAIYTPQGPAPPILPNPTNVLDEVKKLGCNGVLVMPSFIEVWAQSEETVKFLSTLEALMYGGGPLSSENGGKLVAAGVKLCTLYGATEFGTPIRILDTDYSSVVDADVKTPVDWAWLQFSDKVKSNWVDQGDGTYELQLLTCDTHEPSVENMTNPRGYATADLFIPHPTKNGLWRLVGRADDVVVLGSGEKIVPVPQENYLVSTQYASGAIMFGRGQTQAGALIEPRSGFSIDPNDEEALADFREQIWPSVEAANRLAPTFARIFKEMIIVTNPSKPMVRAAKGTVMRKRTLDLYEAEINTLYKTMVGAGPVPPPRSWSANDILPWLLRHAESIHQGHRVDPDKDIFDQGFDSLGATFLHSRLVGALRASANDVAALRAASRVPASFAFIHPTLHGLAVATENLVRSDGSVGSPATSSAEEIRVMLAKYSDTLPRRFPETAETPTGSVVLLLTGSTGSLGSHILADMLSHEHVSRVYTLNRAFASATDKQHAAFRERGLPVELLSSHKLVTLIGDLTREDLGLEQKVLTEIKSSVTHIVHNAWKVDFNLSLQSFDSQIAGACNLIQLCAVSQHPVSFFYTSSVGVARNWNSALLGPIPEDTLPKAEAAAGQGYAASKYVVEKLLSVAADRGLAATCLRLGQISGSDTTGSWPITDWVPILVKSSMALGCLPIQDTAVSWVPVNIISQAVVDYVFAAAKPASRLPTVLNMVHPRPTAWKRIFEGVNNALPSQLPFVSIAAWLEKLEVLSVARTAENLQQVPALKLLDFFRSFGGLPTSTSTGFNTAQAQAYSLAMRNSPPVDDMHGALWVQYWLKVGLL